MLDNWSRTQDYTPAVCGIDCTVAAPQMQNLTETNVTLVEKQIHWTGNIITWLLWLALCFSLKNNKGNTEYGSIFVTIVLTSKGCNLKLMTLSSPPSWWLVQDFSQR